MAANARYDLEDRLIAFAVSVCQLVVRVPGSPVGCHVVVQLMRSATSVAANYGEAQAAESRRDFIHKLRLCLKELREVMVWLKILARLGYLPDAELDELVGEVDELTAIFVTSVSTAVENARRSDR